MNLGYIALFQLRFLAAELGGNDSADFLGANHPVNLSVACPHHSVGLAGEQHDSLQRNLPPQAVVIVERVFVPVRA